MIFLILWGLLILTACGKNTFRIQEETCSANEISEDSSEPTSQTNINVVDSKITSEVMMGSQVVADTENQPTGNQWTSNQSTGKQPASGEANSGQEADLEVEPATCFVYVCGAVMSPGVYELDSDARVQDALNLLPRDFEKMLVPTTLILHRILWMEKRFIFPVRKRWTQEVYQKM